MRTGQWHKLLFYTAARLDGLHKREDYFGSRMTEEFVGRGDGLTALSVEVEMEDSGEKSNLCVGARSEACMGARSEATSW